MVQLINFKGRGFIPIPQNNPRIIVQKGCKNGFKVYRPTSLIGKTKLNIVKILNPFLKTEIGINKKILKPIYEKFGDDILISVYTGTKGYYRKPTILIMNKNGDSIAYAKIALTKQVFPLLENEYRTLLKLQKLKLQTAYIPKVLFYNKRILIQSTMDGKSSATRFIKPYQDFLDELKKKTYKDGKCLVHGDFAPWNIVMADKPFVFDWEMAKYSIPSYDKIHFILQVKLLIHKTQTQKIFKNLKNLGIENIKVYLNEEISRYSKLHAMTKDRKYDIMIKLRKILIDDLK